MPGAVISIECVASSPATTAVTRARPKSMILMRSPGVIIKFSGLMSRCVIPAACAAASPAAICPARSRHLFKWQRAAFQYGPQRVAGEEFMDHVRTSVVFGEIKHGDDVQSAYCQRFLLKPLQSRDVRKQALGQNFESYIATESQVSCPVDLSHATHPQRRDYAISSDRAARRQSHDVVMILLRGIANLTAIRFGPRLASLSNGACENLDRLKIR